jgi:hypothetical protein
MRRPKQNKNREHLRLSVLAAAGLAAGFASSHFDGWWWWLGFEKERLLLMDGKLGEERWMRERGQNRRQLDMTSTYKDDGTSDAGLSRGPNRSRSRLSPGPIATRITSPNIPYPYQTRDLALGHAYPHPIIQIIRMPDRIEIRPPLWSSQITDPPV